MDSDDDLQLSPEALAALQQFLAEKAQQLHEEETLLKTGAQEPEKFEEDWNLSQFWYDEQTSQFVAEEALELCEKKTNNTSKIACVSTPSIFRALKKLVPDDRNYFLFEYDKRFQVYGEQFVFYDVNDPQNLPSNFANAFDVILLDPPFLSEECFKKALQTLHYLAKPETNIIVLTGSVMGPLLLSSVKNLTESSFKPKHQRGLQNEFSCFVNYPSKRLNPVS
mmetsp:Transcript_17453/g.24219  ORF Transcript_17453/g.24219 Transcript_17453/m.24219 type:complete len:223 (-) Transcript_17453:86-754(-)